VIISGFELDSSPSVVHMSSPVPSSVVDDGGTRLHSLLLPSNSPSDAQFVLVDREVVLTVTKGCGFSLRGECPVYILSVTPGTSGQF
jgi:hypothetical protein